MCGSAKIRPMLNGTETVGQKWGELKNRQAPWSKKWGLGPRGPIGVYVYVTGDG